MKTPTLLVCVATTLAGASLIRAAPCTSEQVASLKTLPEVTALINTCAGLATSTPATQTKFCDTTCLTAVETAIKAIPVCEISGRSISASYTAIVDACKGSKSPTSTQSSQMPQAATESNKTSSPATETNKSSSATDTKAPAATDGKTSSATSATTFFAVAVAAASVIVNAVVM